jgi:hypothetical protein
MHSDAEQAIDQPSGRRDSTPRGVGVLLRKTGGSAQGHGVQEYDKAIYLIEQAEINAELAIEKSRRPFCVGR